MRLLQLWAAEPLFFNVSSFNAAETDGGQRAATNWICIQVQQRLNVLENIKINTINEGKNQNAMSKAWSGRRPLPSAVCRMCFNTEIWGREQHTWDAAHTLLEEVVLRQRKQ